ncbi:MAG: CDP-alcohol phosphatidyltransferase family protein [Clostridia bacterium]|nr:CDP-alcohol phosphatidyltransferase family protein [Clostridia bacterium]
MNIPNILTGVRFLIVPILGYYLNREEYYMAILLFLAGGITDILDGYIARKFNMITSWGKLADPMADKLMQITALIVLTNKKLIPYPVLIIVIAKEVFMIAGSILLYKKQKTVVAADWYGKMATVIFFFAILMTIVMKVEKLTNPYTDIMINIFVAIAVIANLFAFFMYSLTYRQIRSDLQ